MDKNRLARDNLTLKNASLERSSLISLVLNENNFGPSPRVLSAIKSIDKDVLLRYPDPNASKLQAAIAEYAGTKADNIVVYNGADEGIRHIVSAFLSKGDELLTYSPTFPAYTTATKLLSANYKAVNLNSDFTLDVDLLMQNISDKTKLVVLCNPNNPTGTMISSSDIEKVLKNTNSKVLIDEAYFEFSGLTFKEKIPKYPNLVILRSLSKAFGMAGLRVGYSVSNNETSGFLRDTKVLFNVNGIAQKIGLVALDDVAYMHETVERIIGNRVRMENALKSCGFEVFESHTNFLFFDVSGVSSSEEFSDFMRQNGILVKAIGRIAGFSGDYVRVTAGTDEDTSKFVALAEGFIKRKS